MRRFFQLFLCALLAGLVILGSHRMVRSHCEIPCGIYGDRTRIDLLYEDIRTVEKSMRQIIELTSKEGVQPLDANQIVRWTTNKEEHANKIQHIVTQYFMTQRVKPKAERAEGREKYIAQLTALHEILVEAMKAKQTVDTTHTKNLRKLVDRFSEAYFSEDDLEHIRREHREER